MCLHVLPRLSAPCRLFLENSAAPKQGGIAEAFTLNSHGSVDIGMVNTVFKSPVMIDEIKVLIKINTDKKVT